MITFLEVRSVKKTRKPWQCDGCTRKFELGTPKNRQRIIGDDGPYSFETCPTCEAVIGILWALESDYHYEGVPTDDIHEYVMTEFGSWEKADEKFAPSPLTTKTVEESE